MAQKEIWKELLKQHDKLVASSQCTMYDRVTLLKKVYEDHQFLEDMMKEGKKPLDVINGKVADTCANFNELLQMLRLWPQRKQWERGSLASMRRDMLDTVDQARNKKTDTGSGSGGSNKPAWKQKYLELEEKYRVLEATYKQLSKDYKELQAILGRNRKAS